MGNQKIINLLNKNDTELSKFSTKKWYIINDQNNRSYGDGTNKKGDTIKFEAKVTKPNLCDYSDAYILVTGKISITGSTDTTKAAFKKCVPFTKCVTNINDEYVETADNLDIIMPMYNLLEYSDNYEESSGSLYQFKRDEPPEIIANDVNTANSESFEYKSKLLDQVNEDGAKIVVPLRYLGNFFRSLEMPLINCKIHLELSWTKDCIMSNNGTAASFQITDTKLYVPIVT